ncbi:MAG: chemotaxis protein CheX [Gemmatimonadaceae bacterium]
MPDVLESPLAEAAVETFERLAYCFAEPGPLGPVSVREVDGVVMVSFRGPVSGGVALQLSGGILASLTENMLGSEHVPSAQQQRDALGEVANVICGNALPRIAGTTAVFALGVPTAFPTWQAAVAAMGEPSAHVRLELEGGRADIAIALSASSSPSSSS